MVVKGSFNSGAKLIDLILLECAINIEILKEETI